jgi:type IV pilus assembly protein PilO
MNINVKKQHILLITILSCILIIALAIFTAITAVDISEANSAIENEEQIYEENEKKLARLEALLLIEDELRHYFDALNKLLPKQADEAGLIQHINRLSETAGLDVAMIDFGDRVVNNNLNEMPMSLSLKGSFPQLVSFMKNVANGERLIRIDQIDIRHEEATADGIIIDMEAVAFYR